MNSTNIPYISLATALLVCIGCGGSANSTNNLSSGGGPVAAKVIGTIAAGTTPTAVAVDPTSDTIYVANFGKEGNDNICPTCYCPGENGTLTSIEGASQTPTTTGFPYAYQNPLDLTVNRANHSLYVASRVFPEPTNPTCAYLGEVEVFAGETIVQTTTAPYPSHQAVFSENVAVNQQSGSVYWSDFQGRSLAVLDVSGNLLNSISLTSGPDGIAVNATTNKIYVATTYPNTSVIVIDGSTNAVVSTITDPNLSYPQGLAVNATTNTIYVANGQGCSSSSNCNNLAVIDGATDSVTTSIPVGQSPAGVAVDSQTNFIYVANAGNYDSNSAGSVTVIDGATNATTTLTDSNLTYPYRIAVNPTTNKIYVLSISSSNVTVIDGAHD